MSYTTYKDIPDFYNRVLRLINMQGSTELTTFIDYAENAPFAESILKEYVSSWNELEEEKIPLFESAVVYQTAINMYDVYSNGDKKVTQTTSMKIEYFERDVSQIIELLNKKLFEIISKLNEGKEIEGTDFIGFMVT